jgi:hypothetical protein
MLGAKSQQLLRRPYSITVIAWLIFSANRSCSHEATGIRVSTAIDLQEPWGSTFVLASGNASRLPLHESIVMNSPNLVEDID